MLTVALAVLGWQLFSLLLTELMRIKPVLDWLRRNQGVACIPAFLLIGGLFLLAWLSTRAFAPKRKVTITCPTCHNIETCVATESEVVTRRLKMLKGAAVLAFGVSLMLCPVSCQDDHLEANYDRGVHFRGNHTIPIVRGFGSREGRLYAVSWSKRNSRLPICPIVVHLSSGDIDETDFASPAAMRRLGAEVRNHFGDWFDMVLRKDGMQVLVMYQHGLFEYVEVMVGHTAVPKDHVTVLGQPISLPTTKERLFQLLGEPLSFREVPPP